MALPREFEAVVFDFDGVLAVGSNEAYFPVYHAAFESVGHHLEPGQERALILSYWSWPSSHFFAHIFREEPEKAARATEVYARGLFTDVFLGALKIDPGLEPMMLRMRESGLKLGVVSGANAQLLQRVLEHHGLADLFGCVISGYDYPAEHQKPSPRMLLEACERLESSPAASLYVGDTDTDCFAARSAGMPFCAVLTGNLTRPAAETLGSDWIVPAAIDVGGLLR